MFKRNREPSAGKKINNDPVKAAVKVQASWRRWFTQRNQKLRHYSATAIQRIIRGVNQRNIFKTEMNALRKVRALEKDSRTRLAAIKTRERDFALLKNLGPDSISRFEALRQENSAKVIQRAVRKNLTGTFDAQESLKRERKLLRLYPKKNILKKQEKVPVEEQNVKLEGYHKLKDYIFAHRNKFGHAPQPTQFSIEINGLRLAQLQTAIKDKVALKQKEDRKERDRGAGLMGVTHRFTPSKLRRGIDYEDARGGVRRKYQELTDAQQRASILIEEHEENVQEIADRQSGRLASLGRAKHLLKQLQTPPSLEEARAFLTSNVLPAEQGAAKNVKEWFNDEVLRVPEGMQEAEEHFEDIQASPLYMHQQAVEMIRSRERWSNVAVPLPVASRKGDRKKRSEQDPPTPPQRIFIDIHKSYDGLDLLHRHFPLCTGGGAGGFRGRKKELHDARMFQEPLVTSWMSEADAQESLYWVTYALQPSNVIPITDAAAASKMKREKESRAAEEKKENEEASGSEDDEAAAEKKRQLEEMQPKVAPANAVYEKLLKDLTLYSLNAGKRRKEVADHCRAVEERTVRLAKVYQQQTLNSIFKEYQLRNKANFTKEQQLERARAATKIQAAMRSRLARNITLPLLMQRRIMQAFHAAFQEVSNCEAQMRKKRGKKRGHQGDGDARASRDSALGGGEGERPAVGEAQALHPVMDYVMRMSTISRLPMATTGKTLFDSDLKSVKTISSATPAVNKQMSAQNNPRFSSASSPQNTPSLLVGHNAWATPSASFLDPSNSGRRSPDKNKVSKMAKLQYGSGIASRDESFMVGLGAKLVADPSSGYDSAFSTPHPSARSETTGKKHVTLGEATPFTPLVPAAEPKPARSPRAGKKGDESSVGSASKKVPSLVGIASKETSPRGAVDKESKAVPAPLDTSLETPQKDIFRIADESGLLSEFSYMHDPADHGYISPPSQSHTGSFGHSSSLNNSNPNAARFTFEGEPIAEGEDEDRTVDNVSAANVEGSLKFDAQLSSDVVQCMRSVERKFKSGKCESAKTVSKMLSASLINFQKEPAMSVLAEIVRLCGVRPMSQWLQQFKLAAGLSPRTAVNASASLAAGEIETLDLGVLMVELASDLGVLTPPPVQKGSRKPAVTEADMTHNTIQFCMLLRLLSAVNESGKVRIAEFLCLCEDAFIASVLGSPLEGTVVQWQLAHMRHHLLQSGARRAGMNPRSVFDAMALECHNSIPGHPQLNKISDEDALPVDTLQAMLARLNSALPYHRQEQLDGVTNDIVKLGLWSNLPMTVIPVKDFKELFCNLCSYRTLQKRIQVWFQVLPELAEQITESFAQLLDDQKRRLQRGEFEAGDQRMLAVEAFCAACRLSNLPLTFSEVFMLSQLLSRAPAKKDKRVNLGSIINVDQLRSIQNGEFLTAILN